MRAKIKRDASSVIGFINRYGSERSLYTYGNGGSSSIADHMATDWMKGTDGQWSVISLSSNNSLLSAISNDLGVQNTCLAQLQWLPYPRSLILISSSGTSENIVEAAKYAHMRIPLITFTGSCGVQKDKTHVSTYANLSIHLESCDYGAVEDYHSNVMHEVVRQLRNRK